MPIYTHPLSAGCRVPYVTRSCLDRPRPDHHCPAMTGALYCIPLLRFPSGIRPDSHHPDSRRLGLDLLCPIHLVLVRSCWVLDRNSAPTVPPSHHSHRRNLRRFGVYGCPEVVRVWH